MEPVSTVTFWASIGNTISSALKSIGLGGSTKHPSFDAVSPKGWLWADTMFARFIQAYGADVAPKIMSFVRVNFQYQMTQWWGLEPSLNQQIKLDISQTDDLRRAFWLYYVWVGTNQDQDAGEDTKANELNGIFRNIFISAIVSANLSTESLIGGTPMADINVAPDTSGTPVKVTVTPPGSTNILGVVVPVQASSLYMILAIGVVGIYFLATRKKR